MSIEALDWVLRHSPTAGADRLVLIAIANHASDGPTWESYPGKELIRREAGITRAKTVSEVLARLEAAGHIERIVNAAPDPRMRADRRTNLYRVLTGTGVTCGDPNCGWSCPAWADHGIPLAELAPGGIRPDGGAVDGSPQNDPPSPRVPGIRPNGSPDTARTGPRYPGTKPSVEPSVEPSSTHRVQTDSADEPPAPTPAVAEPAPKAPRIPKGVNPDDVDALIEHLHRRVSAHRGREPRVTAAWQRDMGTLLNTGPPDVKGDPPTAGEVHEVIDALFDHLATRSSKGFCWADQVQSPQGLRNKWEKITFELHKFRHRRGARTRSSDQLAAAVERLNEMTGGGTR